MPLRVFTTLALAGSTLAALFTCQTSSSIPYCVHDPSNGSGGLPMMLFMPGSGARGSYDNAASLATYDGMGRMISEYASGNTDEAHTIAANKFLTVVPISPDGTRHFWPEDMKGIIEDVQSNYKVSGSKVSVSGYSMGSRGCNRFVVTYPDMVSSAGCSAGSAEQSGDGTLTQDPSRTASATYPLLSNAVNVPIMIFAGMSDTTAGYTGSVAEEAQLKKLGSTVAILDELSGATHADMSIKPWADTDYLSWALSLASSSGGSASSSKTASATKTSQTGKSTKTRSATGTTKATKTATRSTNPKATSVPSITVGSKVGSKVASSDDEDDEDCDDDDDDSDDEDDCEEEDDGSDDDDCDEEDGDDTSSNSTASKRALPALELPTGRETHHFVFPHSRRDVGLPALRSAPRSVKLPPPHLARRHARAKLHSRMVRMRRH